MYIIFFLIKKVILHIELLIGRFKNFMLELLNNSELC